MKHTNSILSAKILLLAVFVSLSFTPVQCRYFTRQKILPDINDYPVIGIYAIPSKDEYGYPTKDYQYVLNANLQWIKMSGAQTIIIPFDETQEYYDNLFKQINGVYFAGGELNIDINVQIPFQPNTGKNQWTENAAYIINKAISENENGGFFPVWGNCQGFELLHYVISGYNYTVLNHINNNYNVSRSANLMNIESSNTFSQIHYELIEYAEKGKPFLYLHEQAITTNDYKHNPKLSSFFKILGISSNSTDIHSNDSLQFIALVESHKYPIGGAQFHPEYTLFQPGFNSNHHFKSLDIAQYFSRYFVSLARKNNHKFTSDVERESKLSYNHPSVHVQQGLFDEITFIPRKQN